MSSLDGNSTVTTHIAENGQLVQQWELPQILSGEQADHYNQLVYLQQKDNQRLHTLDHGNQMVKLQNNDDQLVYLQQKDNHRLHTLDHGNQMVKLQQKNNQYLQTLDYRNQRVQLQNNDDQGLGIQDKLDDQGLGIQDKLDDQGLGIQDKLDDQGLGIQDKLDDQGLGIQDRLDNPCEGCLRCKCKRASIRPFMCAGCLAAFSSICDLHAHLEHSHTDSELYYFDKVTQTAFPKYGTACKVTQTETDIIQNATSNVFGADPSLKRVYKVDPDETAPTGAVSSGSTLFASGPAQDIHVNHVEEQSSSTGKEKYTSKSIDVVYVQDVSSGDVEVVNVLSDASIKTELLTADSSSEHIDDIRVPAITIKNEVDASVDESLLNTSEKKIVPRTPNKKKAKKKKAVGKRGRTKKVLTTDDAYMSVDEHFHNSSKKEKVPIKADEEKAKKNKAVGKRKRSNEKLIQYVKRDKTMNDKYVSADESLPNADEKEIVPITSKKEKVTDTKVIGKTKTTKPKIIIQCEQCDKTFTNQHLLKRHGATHVGPRTYHCDLCNKSFATNSSLRSHIAAFHTDEKNFVCQHCGLMYATKTLLQTHIKKCLDIRPFACSYENCTSAYREKGTLEKHVRKHTGEMPFVCEVCGRGYKCISTLNVHRIVHSGERPNKCDQCPKTFTTRGRLNRHKRIHENVTPCVCECGKAFTNNWNLKAHQRQHNNDRPYSCDVCGESFKHNVSKKNHMKVHSTIEVQYTM